MERVGNIMFENVFIESKGKGKTTLTVLFTFGGEVLLIVVGLLIPMIYYDVLPATELTSFLVAPLPPPPPPPPPPPAPEVVKVVPFDATKLMAPKEVPRDIAAVSDVVRIGVVGGVPGGYVGGTVGGVIGGIIGSVPVAAPPPPPVVKAKPKPKPPQRIRVGGSVQRARLLRQPKPVYPPLARQARIQGTVRFNAIIGKDGRIANLTLVSGHPLLVPSAQAAVKQWVYKPTLLNGEPVEVVTQIDVNFTLTG